MTVRRWARVCSIHEIDVGRGVAALVDGQQVALFRLPGAGGEPSSHLRAIDNHDPVSGANVLAHGIVGTSGDVDYVASPMHKHRFDLASGRCLDGESPGVRVWPVRVWGSTVEVLAVTHPPPAPAPATTTTATHCPYCALQCGMGLRGPSDTQASLEVVADVDFPVNRGRMCIKGWSAVELLDHPDRIRHPLIRNRCGELVGATWDAALDELADRLRRLRAEHGADSVAVFGSGALTNEKAYLLGKFARVALGTANIDYNGRYCMSSAAAANNRAFGIDRGLPFPLADIAETDTLLVWGANPADTMPPLMQWVDRQRANGGTLIVVDPRLTATAALADFHLQPVPGTDLAVALGLLHLAIERRLIDVPFVETRTSGFDDVRRSVVEWTPERTAQVSGIEPGTLLRAAEAMGTVASSMLLSGRGPEQQSKGVDTVTAMINLMLALGRVGRAASGYGCLTGQGNGQGGREHGQKADQLPGYRSIIDDADRSAIATVWDIDPTALPGPGLSAVDMLDAIGTGAIRGLLVAGSDVALASPDRSATVGRLAGLDCLAVLDSFPTATTAMADIVLPVTQWAEEDGTTTNLEGRVLRRRRAVDPPAGIRSDLDVLCALASRLGQGDRFDFGKPEAVFDELRRASRGGRADYDGITYARLDQSRGIYWPCPTTTHPGTPRLFADRFAHPDGLAHFQPVTYRPADEEPDEQYPLRLTTGRYREHYNSGNQTRRVTRLATASRAPRLQIHPDLAMRLGLSDDATVIVESRRGTARFTVGISPDIRDDTVFAPIHWGAHEAVNLLTNRAVDPISRMPELKVCAVNVRGDPPPREA